ncbi:hypothetical protein [Pontibacter sp. G13]|uniref:hypothetical protein n=1 Tax=Pontibacter sp. G13 TaxID=3074898 RepID=UPI002889BD00|nr:hypothetical protein [Pontibacter sp. G13]WNJ20310.1 hypothetical protein RJD25_07505 [Pontibacter sp. G13]
MNTLGKWLMMIVLISSVAWAQDSPKAPPSAEEIAKANNPLADILAFNVHYYYRPRLNGIDGGMANTLWFRFAMPTGPVLWRVSAPLETRFINNPTTNFSASGLGDIDLFGAYLVKSEPTFTFGIGPSIAFNTGTTDGIGSGRNSLGLAAVIYAVPIPQIQIGGLIIWRTDIGGDDTREKVNFIAIQPFYFWQLGKGVYFRGAPIIPIDLENGGNYSVPLGIGVGKVAKIEGIVFNFFMEAEPSILVVGTGQPTTQIFGGVNMQF